MAVLRMPVGLPGFAVGLLLISAARAAEVRVTDDEGRPVIDALVACLGQQTDAALTGEDGIAIVPDACKKIHCERGGLVPDETVIQKGKGACRLRAGLILTLEVVAADCGDGCFAFVYDPLSIVGKGQNRRIADGGARRADSGRIWPSAASKKAEKLERRFLPLLPGRYRLEFGRDSDTWQCGIDLGELPAGAHSVTGLLRKPAVLKGRVLDREGKPIADVPLFVRPETTTAEDQIGVWTCAVKQEEGHEPLSAEDGSFRALIDPGASVRIEAGWEGYPIGTAAVSIRGVPDRELVLRLK